MPRRTLEDWLDYQQRVHPRAMDFTLDRMRALLPALGLGQSRARVITVGGTNGKGSCCAMLEAMLLEAGFRVGCYTSPHLLRYNERARIDGRPLEDPAWCGAFGRVERARGATLLTYFEFGTLAAVLAFADARVDVAILEVGLGGRLDAVNVFDADCALIASVDLDHQDYLGSTRESIGFEKAGIFRAGRPAVCADTDPPATLVDHARSIGARLLLADRDFGHVTDPVQWRYWGAGGRRPGLPYPALRGHYQLGNAAACITVLDELRDRLPVTAQDVRGGLVQVTLNGRFQVLPGRPLVVLDVAHNPHAARALSANLREMPARGRTFAVFAMFRDKDIAGVAAAVEDAITEWFIADAEGVRGATAQHVAEELSRAGVTACVKPFVSVAHAWRAACERADEDDKIIVFGSFLTVAAVMRERQGNG